MNPFNFRPVGPSRHYEMPQEARLILYRRLIGALTLADLPKRSQRQEFDLQCTLSESSLVTKSLVRDAHEQAHLLRVLLSKCLNEKHERLELQLQPSPGRVYGQNYSDRYR